LLTACARRATNFAPDTLFMVLNKLITDIKSSLWFTPGVITLVCAALAIGAVELDGYVGDDVTQRFPRLFGAGAEGSRQLLAAIASSTITVAGVVFSITIVALSMAAAQYSPRVLRNFMGDRSNQVVLGVFVGVFVYCLLVLRTVRGGDDEFLPGLSILLAIVLAITAIGFLIYFIHHIATSIQVSEMASRITQQTLQALETYGESRSDEAIEEDGARLEDMVWIDVPAAHKGYIQRVDEDALVGWARERKRIVRTEKPVGEFIVPGECLASVSGSARPSDDDVKCLNAAFTLNTYRDLAQDPAFGLQQLVDIALKALSPGVNDTGTARDALNYITAILAEIARAPAPTLQLRSSDGRLALLMRVRSFEEFVQLALGPLRRSARANFEFTQHLLGSLTLLAAISEESDVRQALALEVAATEETFERSVLSSGDKLRLAGAVREALERLAPPEARAA
jgi:uncharacterized membrane protein